MDTNGKGEGAGNGQERSRNRRSRPSPEIHQIDLGASAGISGRLDHGGDWKTTLLLNAWHYVRNTTQILRLDYVSPHPWVPANLLFV